VVVGSNDITDKSITMSYGRQVNNNELWVLINIKQLIDSSSFCEKDVLSCPKMKGSDMSVEFQFRQVGRLCEDDKKTVIFTKDAYFKLIDELKVAIESVVKNGRQYSF